MVFASLSFAPLVLVLDATAEIGSSTIADGFWITGLLSGTFGFGSSFVLVYFYYKSFCDLFYFGFEKEWSTSSFSSEALGAGGVDCFAGAAAGASGAECSIGVIGADGTEDAGAAGATGKGIGLAGKVVAAGTKGDGTGLAGIFGVESCALSYASGFLSSSTFLTSGLVAGFYYSTGLGGGV